MFPLISASLSANNHLRACSRLQSSHGRGSSLNWWNCLHNLRVLHNDWRHQGRGSHRCLADMHHVHLSSPGGNSGNDSAERS